MRGGSPRARPEGAATSEKRYDADYYRRFYLDPRSRVLEPMERRLRVAAAVAATERWLGRPLRSALDVGCGLGLWGRELVRLRPRARYLGLDSSSDLRPRRRGRFELRRGSFAECAALPSRARFDLVLCVDVMHYLGRREVDDALATLVPRARCALLLEVLTAAEPIEGDLDGLVRRSPTWWRDRFARHGLVAVGSHLYLSPALADLPAEMERTGAEAERRRGRRIASR